MFKKNKKEKLEYVFSIKTGSHNSAQVFLDLLNENESTQKESKVYSYNFIFHQIDTTEQEQKLKKDQHEQTHYEFRIK